MRWQAVRHALGSLYGPVFGSHARSMPEFARAAGLNVRTVRRLLTTEAMSTSPIEWETIRGWLRATNGPKVSTFLAQFEEPPENIFFEAGLSLTLGAAPQVAKHPRLTDEQRAFLQVHREFVLTLCAEMLGEMLVLALERVESRIAPADESDTDT